MTRFLSEVLQAPEPFFRQGLKQLEAATGHPNTDIRLSTEVMRASQDKLRQLRLDPRDTTAEELYHALQERVKADDARLNKKLRTLAATHVSAEGDVVSGMVYALQALPDSKRCFAIKGSVLKVLLKKSPPKKAMKQLGYRSVDSFLKHESPTNMLAAAWLCEGEQWQVKLLDQYKRLRPSDFESRTIALAQPTGKRWRELSERAVSERRHNLLCLKELGALVFLPLPVHSPAGTTTVGLCSALHALNEIRAASSYLKLCQVRPDFGQIVCRVARDETRLNSELLEQSVPWHLIQQYFSRLTHDVIDQVFEPHLQLDDLVWHPIERALSALEPRLDFWHDSGHVGLFRGGQAVSLNILDNALNFCNQLPFERRVVQSFQASLWHELLLRYLHHDAVDSIVMNELQPQEAETSPL